MDPFLSLFSAIGVLVLDSSGALREKCLDSDGSVWGFKCWGLSWARGWPRGQKVPEGASCAIDGSTSSESCFAIRAVYRDGVAVFRWVLDFWFTEMEGTSDRVAEPWGSGWGWDPPL